MMRANLVSMGASVLMIVGFLIAIPDGIGDLLGQSKNPLIYIFQSHFGVIAADVLQVVVFLAIFSCVLANMVVATRLTSRSPATRCCPARRSSARVNTTTRTPIASIVLVAAVGIGINMLSAGIAANVVSICSVAYYFVYLLTVGGAIYAHFSKRMPATGPVTSPSGGGSSPSRYRALRSRSGVVVIALAPKEGHIAGSTCSAPRSSGCSGTCSTCGPGWRPARSASIANPPRRCR